MKIKKIFLILLMLIVISGCTNVNDLTYDNIINTLSLKAKNPNEFRKGYQYYVPKGLLIEESGTNYAILSSNGINYYLYVDLVSYFNKNRLSYENSDNLVYSEHIKYQNKTGYVEIKLLENNKYLIEIMYNYAKIEVMVEENLINNALLNSISILNSIRYNDSTIERMLNDDELSYTEENYELFDDDKSNSNILNSTVEEVEDEEEVKDTDFIN